MTIKQNTRTNLVAHAYTLLFDTCDTGKSHSNRKR